jgi:Putative transposase
MAGFTLHAATHAGAKDERGREALLRYVLRPPIAQKRIIDGPDGLVRIVLKKAFSDGTIAVDMDPLSLLCRLAAMVPPPYFHTARYAGVLASHHAWCSRIVAAPPPKSDGCAHGEREPTSHRSKTSCYRPSAELLKRTFAIDVETCAKCKGTMKLVSLIKERRSIARLLRHLGEPTDPQERAPARAPPYWQSRALRRKGSMFAA